MLKRLLFIFIGLVLLIKTKYLIYDDVIIHYPFISYDGFQWITDSLYYLNPSINISHRNPALPLIFTFLKILNVERFYPVLLSALLFMFYYLNYRGLRLFYCRKVSTVTVFCFFFMFKIHNFFDYILADQWALTLMVASIYFLLRFKLEKKVKYLYFFFVAAAISFNFQYAIAFISPAVLYYMYLNKDLILQKQSDFIKGAILFLVLVSLNFIHKWLRFNNPLFTSVVHFGILKLHFFGLFYYLIGFLGYAGIPFGIVIAKGFFESVKKQTSEWAFLNLITFCYFVFWVLLYQWLDVRFLLYFVPVWFFYFALIVEKYWDRVVAFNTKNIIANIFSLLLFLFSISLPSYLYNAFGNQELPITSQNILHFGSENITNFGGNVNINIDNLKLESKTNIRAVFPFLSYFKFYEQSRSQLTKEKSDLLNDLNNIEKKLEKNTNVGFCGEMLESYYVRMQSFNVLKQNIEGCSNNLKFLIKKQNDKIQIDSNMYKSIFTGNILNLYERNI